MINKLWLVGLIAYVGLSIIALSAMIGTECKPDGVPITSGDFWGFMFTLMVMPAGLGFLAGRESKEPYGDE